MYKTKKITLSAVVGYIFTFLIAVTILVPNFWLLVSSFKTDVGVIRFPPRFFPEEWTLHQYLYVGDSIPIFEMTKNTVIFAGGVRVFTLQGSVFHHPADDDGAFSDHYDAALYRGV